MANLLSSLFGDDDLSSIDDKIDSLMKSMSSDSENTVNQDDRTGSTIDSMLSVAKGDNSDGQYSQNEIDQLFQNVSIPSERQARYALYDDIYRSIPIIKRILKVYKTNIMQTNPVQNKSYLVHDLGNEDKTKTTQAKETVHKIFKSFKIIQKLNDYIVPKMLLFGDYFVESVNINEEAKDIDVTKQVSSQSFLYESKQLNTTLDKLSIRTFDSEVDSIFEKFSDLMVQVENSGVVEQTIQKNVSLMENQDSDDDSITFDNTLLKLHPPHNIIMLETKYGTKIGYLEVKQSSNTALSYGNSQVLSTVVDKMNQSMKRQGAKHNTKQLVDQLVKTIVKNIVKKTNMTSQVAGSNNDISSDKLSNALDDHLMKFIKRMLIEQGLESQFLKNNTTPLKVRFIPATKMVHFSTGSTAEYSPYSESIIENLILPGKLYLISKLANVVNKLSRASLIRKWTIDPGPTQMHSQMIQKVKRELHNSRVTLNDFSNFKSIPKLMSDFKDMFVIGKEGRRSIDVDVQNMGDTNIGVDDLRDSRDEIVSLSGVPGSHLGLEQRVELRESLVHANVNFAIEINSMQNNIGEGLNQLIDMIVSNESNQDLKPSDYVKVDLLPPVVLMLQLIENTLSSVGNISGTFNNMNIDSDPYYFLQLYIPQIDWEQFKKRAEQYKLEQGTKTEMGGEEQQSAGW